MPVLSAEDRAFWEENGYVVVREAVPPENCRPAEQAVWEFLGMNPDDPESWYPDPPRRGIMLRAPPFQFDHAKPAKITR